ncbi:MAG TPA: septal ring lytic transglycosylase RlpA family protein [Solirubrobacteraceae bacterium]|nr:septal ring lytic transglycosylase RlpA family protein [Solirubrobacteraceae bacterium]
MKRRAILRESRLMQAAVGVTVIAAPTSAALADAPQAAAPLQTHVKSHRLRYGQAVVLDGRAPASDAGQTVELAFASSASTSWQAIAFTQIAPGGGFRLSAPLSTSGSVKVSISAAGGAAASAAASASSPPQRVAVAASLRVRRHARELFGPRRIEVQGVLLPRSGRHRVLLQTRSGRRWRTLARGYTRSNGRFALRYFAVAAGNERLRVRFPGDRSNAAVTAPAGRVTVFHPSVASWYYDGGTTACGFHAQYGVANLSLPCGARVQLSYGGRTVTAVVDDRGPYVGGREWDLNQNTAAALGFGGVGTVWSSR